MEWNRMRRGCSTAPVTSKAAAAFKHPRATMLVSASSFDGARIDGRSIVADGNLDRDHKQVDIGQPGGYGYQWWTRDNGTFNAWPPWSTDSHRSGARLVVAINGAWTGGIHQRIAPGTHRTLERGYALRLFRRSNSENSAAWISCFSVYGSRVYPFHCAFD
jgi:hypothetical protein